MSQQIDDLFLLFNQQSEKVKRYLSDILQKVTEGEVPSSEEMKDLNDEVEELGEKYNDVYKLAQDTVSEEELPKYGSALEEVVTAVKDSHNQYIMAQLTNAKNILEKFISVKSLIEEYANALSSYQEDAKKILDQINENTVEDLLPKTEAPGLFLKAMESDNIHNSKGIELLNKLKDFYPEDEIRYGLIGKQFYFFNNENKKNDIDSDEQNNKKTVEKGLSVENSLEIDSKSASDAEDLPKEVEKPNKEANNTADKNGEVLEGNLTAVNKVKMSSPNASSFKKEIAKMHEQFEEIETILSLFTHFGVMDKILVYFLGEVLDCFDADENEMDRVYKAVDMLADKGFLAAFDISSEISEEDILYCLSSYCSGSMHKETVVRQMKTNSQISFGPVNIMADKELNTMTAVMFWSSNCLLGEYLSAQKHTLDSDKYNKIKSSIKWEEKHYQVAVFFNEKLVNAVVAADYIVTSSIKAKYIILSLSLCEIPEQFNSVCEKVFVVADHKVYCCDPAEDIKEQISILDSKEISDSGEADKNLDSSDKEVKVETVGVETVEQTVPADITKSVGYEEETSEPMRVRDSLVGNEDIQVKLPEPENIEAAEEDGIPQGVIPLDKMTAQDLLDLGRTPSDEEFCSVIHSLLNQVPKDDKSLNALIVQANLLAEGAGLEKECPSSKLLSTQLQLATNVLRTDNEYSSINLSNVFSGAETDVPALTLSAYMFALLAPEMSYVYQLQAQAEIYRTNFDSYFPEELFIFKDLFNIMADIPKVNPVGFTPAVIALLGNEDKQERFNNDLKIKAQGYLTVNPPNVRMNALPILYSNEFGEGSDLYACMEIISKGDIDSLDFVECVLGNFCDEVENVYRINNKKIEKQLDKAWDKANPKNKFSFGFSPRNQAINQYKFRLEVMLSWTENTRNQSKNKKNIGKLKSKEKGILEQINNINRDNSWRQVKDANVLRWLLLYIPKYLNGEISQISIYEDVLNTGIFSLSEDGVPEIDSSLAEIKYYENWRNALKHIVAERRSVEDITNEILDNAKDIVDEDKSLKDNLRQLEMLGKLLGKEDEDDYIVTEQQIKEAKESAEYKANEFMDRLELAYTYYQINETEKENLAGIMNQYKARFYEIGDFACWRKFLDALGKQIQEFSNGRKDVLNARLQKNIQQDKDAPILIEAGKLIEKDSNFVVAEEYLNRYEAGERDLDRTPSVDKDYFSEFLSDDVFDPLYDTCQKGKGNSLKNFGKTYIEKHFPKDWSKRLRESSRSLIANWPTRKGDTSPTQIEDLFNGLGFSVIKATKTGGKEELWRLYVEPTERGLADYLHPIAAFGTQMKSPLDVICLYGIHTSQQIVDVITSMNLGGISLVLINQPISVSDRRLVGEIFHTQKSGQNPFLLIDQVLILYLAKLQETERMPALLKCTLPYATYQPFIRDAGSTADEMFCGREQELTTIMDHNGACVVYGGRQLGKTALLQRAESRCNSPEKKEFAILSSIINLTSEEEVVARLVKDINNKTEGKLGLKPCTTIGEMCNQIETLFRKKQICSMYLFIDEVDDFLGAIAPNAYKPLQAFVELWKSQTNFKFVIAGLHNVCRAENATKNNGIFGQLGAPLCINPLSPNDALQLLSKPLKYLGFQIENYPHLETILAKSNYYPGILQFVGYKLVETLSGQYSKYYSATKGNPPFTLLDEQLGTVMNSSDLNSSIKEKFRWSLELDPCYFMIARCITMLYLLYKDDSASDSWRGFAVEDIMNMAEDYDIHCLSNLAKQEYINLLDEMVEMGILGKPEKEKDIYRLRRNSFVDIIGRDMDVLDEEIKSNNI